MPSVSNGLHLIEETLTFVDIGLGRGSLSVPTILRRLEVNRTQAHGIPAWWILEIVRWSQHLTSKSAWRCGGTRWVGADFWDQATDDTLTLDALLARSEVVVMGIDGGGLDDLLAGATRQGEGHSALASVVQGLGKPVCSGSPEE